MINRELFYKEVINSEPSVIYGAYWELNRYAGNLAEHFKLVCYKFLDDVRIINCPASSGVSRGGKVHHHGFSGGLIIHTLQVVNAAISLAKADGSNNINFDMLISGAILHDWGKLFVYGKWGLSKDREGRFDITNNAILERHLPRSYGEFMVASSNWNELQQQDRLNLAHIILSHHGHKEWGSPVECKTSEAYCIHLADVYSSRAMIGGDGIEKLL